MHLRARLRALLRPAVFAARRARQRIGRVLRPPVPWNGVHDPALQSYEPWTGIADGRFQHDFLGVKTDPRFRPQLHADPPGPLTTRYPSPHAGYFELAFVLQAITEAKERATFTVLELGAGYGYWLAVAHRARKRTSEKPIRLVGVEMVERHVTWMRAHFENNGIDPKEHLILHAAVSDKDGVAYYRPEENAWLDYGQTVVGRTDAGGIVPVLALPLARILEETGHVDLLHADLQGEEGKALPSAINELTSNVRRLVCATHSRNIHKELRDKFTRANWRIVDDFNFRKRERTRLGDVQFLDGLLTMINPTFESTK